MVDFVDIHSHTLPGVDDGSASFEISLAMPEVALSQGVGTLVLTPHLRPIDGTDKEEEHRERFAEFKQVVREVGIEIDLHFGLEIAFRFNMPEVAAWPTGHLADGRFGRRPRIQLRLCLNAVGLILSAAPRMIWKNDRSRC